MECRAFKTFCVSYLYFTTIHLINSMVSRKIEVFPTLVRVKPGERIQANCTIASLRPPFMLQWVARDSGDTFRDLKQTRVNRTTQSLIILKAQPQDTGSYDCELTDANGSVSRKTMRILVEIDGASSSGCKEHFRCHSQHEIFCRYRCDGRENCPDGSDEWNCPSIVCQGKFHCKNGKCIDYTYVCDPAGENHCEDWSDEDNCPLPTDKTPIVPKLRKPATDDQMTWLKTTVYTVIACTVGVVLFISIVVIAVFRIKMKRAAVRRSLRQAERRRQRHENHGRGRHRRDSEEHSPFISAPSPAHFGNIIVNVNNGVQYVPNTEFSALQLPPSYSEVLEESGPVAVGRHSPPPEYTTIDRNPSRLSSPLTGDLHLRLSNDVVADARPVAANTNIDCDADNVSPVQHSDPLDGGLRDSAANIVGSIDSIHANSNLDNTTDAALRSACRHVVQSQESGADRQHLDHRSQRPKQLQVRHGQIILDGSSSESPSPETVNQITQTNPADLNSTNQIAAKPSQLHVHGGQITLSNQASGEPVSAERVVRETQGATADEGQGQGQLEVKDGQIVFKSS